MIPTEIRPQADAVVDELRRALGDDLIGVYLHGSAVLGCFGPGSDIDLVVVSRHPVGAEQRHHLVSALPEISAPYEPAGAPRPVELDLVLAAAISPWRYPVSLDFHYSEEFRARFRAGEIEAWEGLESRNLATHVTVLHDAAIALVGPPVEQLFPEVPWADYVDALTHDLDLCRTRFAERPRYGVLSIARNWATVATGVPHSKATGAEWTLPRLPAELQRVLEHGLNVYTTGAEERWNRLPVADYIAFVADEVEAAHTTLRSTSSGSFHGPPARCARSANVTPPSSEIVASRTSSQTSRSVQPTIIGHGSGLCLVAQLMGASWPWNSRTMRSSVISSGFLFSR